MKQHRLSQSKAGGAVLINQNNTGLTPSVPPSQSWWQLNSYSLCGDSFNHYAKHSSNKDRTEHKMERNYTGHFGLKYIQ